MCSTAGKIYFDVDRKINPLEIKEMTNTLIHQGPDDEGIYINNNIGLGFRKLNIIDLKSGHKPLSNFYRTIWITFNGEIYNFRELHAELIKKGNRFNKKTDT